MSYFKATEWGGDWSDKTTNQPLMDGMERAYQKAFSALRSTRFTRYERAYLYMHCMHDPRALQNAVTEAGRQYSLDSSLFRPLFITQVMTAKPRLKDSLRGAKAPFRIEPDVSTKGVADGESVEWAECKRYQQFMNWQLAKHIAWHQLLDPLLMDAIPYGNAIVKFDWLRRADRKWEMAPTVGGQGSHELKPVMAPQVASLQGVQAWEIVEDHIRAGLVSPWQWLPDPRGRSIRGKHDRQPCRYVEETGSAAIEDLVVAVMSDPTGGWQYPNEETLAVAQAVVANGSDIEAIQRLEKDVREWLAQYEGSYTEQCDPVRGLQSKAKKLGGSVDADQEDRQVAAILHFYGAGPDPWYIVRIGGTGGAILKKQRGVNHPSIFAPIPCVVFAPKRMSNELNGFGLIDLLDDLQREDNAWANLLLTAFRESMNGITILDSGRNMTQKKLLGSPNRIIEVANPGGLPLADMVHHIERPIPNVGAVMAMLGLINEDAQRAAAGTDPMQGAGATSAAVRTTAMMVDQGGRRWGDEADNLGIQAGEMGEVMDALNKQHSKKATFFRQPGGEGPSSVMPIGVDIMQRRYEIAFNTNPVVVDEQAALGAHTQFVATYLNVPEFNRTKAITEHAKMLHKEDPDEYAVVHPKDAQMENEFFTKNGQFPWPAQMHDDHIYHDQEHQKMEAWVRGMDPGVQPLLLQGLAMHRNTHMAYMGAAVMQGQQPKQPTQPPPPPKEGEEDAKQVPGGTSERPGTEGAQGQPAGAMPPMAATVAAATGSNTIGQPSA